MTEEEAKTKWCPHVRYYPPTEQTNDWTWNRSGYSGEPSCIGSACSQWRWKKVDALINRETREIKVIEKLTIYNEVSHLKTTIISDKEGYCGLAGKP